MKKQSFLFIISFVLPLSSCYSPHDEITFKNPIFYKPMIAYSRHSHDVQLTPTSETDLETKEVLACALLENTKTSVFLKCKKPDKVIKGQQKSVDDFYGIGKYKIEEYFYNRYTHVIHSNDDLNVDNACTIIRRYYSNQNDSEFSSAGSLLIPKYILPNNDCGPAELWESVFDPEKESF